MEIPEYVTVEEVQRVCKALGIRDWTQIPDAKVPPEEVAIILKGIKTDGLEITLEIFRQGLEVELEHGTRYPSANVTNNHPILTGKIVLAHLKETLDYYDRLEVAELEGDVLKAVVSGNSDKLLKYLKKLILAKRSLVMSESEQIGNR